MGGMRQQLTSKKLNGHFQCPAFFSELPLSGLSLVLSLSFPDRLGKWISVSVLDPSLWTKENSGK